MSRLMLIPVFALMACQPPDLGDTGAGLEVAEVAGAIGWVERDAELSTVATVHWRTPGSSLGRVWVREAGEEDWTAAHDEVEPTEEHALILRGLAVETDYEIRVEPDLDEATAAIDMQISTGEAPDWLPETGLDLDGPEVAYDGYFVVPLVLTGSSDSVGAILDGQGRLVWYDDNPGWVTRMRVSPDRQSVVLLRHSPTVDGMGSLVWLSWDRQVLREESFPGMHTDFAFLPDGRVAVLGRETREMAPGRPFLGETIVVIGPDGSQEVAWRVLDEVPPDLGELYSPCPEAIGVECYAHLNSLAYVEDHDAFLLTAASLETAMLVDRVSGELRWALGGPESDFEVAGMDEIFGYPHSAQLVPGGVLVFDDRSPLFDGCSAAVEFSLDVKQGKATTPWKYEPDEHIANHFLGNAQRLEDGRTLVVLPDLGALDIVDADGRLEQRVSTQRQGAVRYGQAIESLYP